MLRLCSGGARRCSTKSNSSFDIDVVNKNFENRVKWAAANYGNPGSKHRMILPPPNVTGKLHLGHALTVTVEDTICRQHRMKGGVASWIPGFDHAGIATQTVVERELWKDQGLRRDQMSKGEFVEECRKWSAKNSSTIRKQLDMLGATLDWNSAYYTLDEKFSKAVTEAFCRLHSDYLIYRDKRIVNWCPALQSYISDQEVSLVELPSTTLMTIPSASGEKRVVEVGTMYCVKYPLESTDRYITVATTRPETIFADVAIAVHPDDDRYSMLVGKTVRNPLCDNRRLPIVADQGVQMSKGTGALKITPFHSARDWEIASRHREEILKVHKDAFDKNCIDLHGRLTQEALEFEGLDRFDARPKIIAKLCLMGLLGDTMKHDAQISVCSRTGDIVEPRLTNQWFMNTAELYSDAEKLVRSNRIKLMPTTQEQKFFDWCSNKDPWCLSRQLVWGHRIPAYRTKNSSWVVARSMNDALKHFGCDTVVQDDDVLDTWFSSSLIPLVTAGWPGPEYNPSEPFFDVLETGWDILGFWVARMIIVTMRLTGGQLPFTNIVLHGLVRDSSGKKMSKSLGNVIDPLDVIYGISKDGMIERVKASSILEEEKAAAISAISNRFPEGIVRAGPDALRFALLRHDLFSADVLLNIVDLSAEGLKFCNKLWNMVKYVETVSEQSPTLKEVGSEHPADEWILSRLANVLELVDKHMSSYSPHLAFMQLHSFILGNLCDVYLETTKRALWDRDLPRIIEIRATLIRVVQPTLVQLSVFMPFVAEHLYERLFSREPGSIYFDFVKPSIFRLHRNVELESDMEILLEVVSAVRSVRQHLQLPSSMAFSGFVHCDDVSRDFSRLSPVMSDLAKFNLIATTSSTERAPSGFMTCNLPGHCGQISLEIEESYRPEFILRMQRLMKKSVDRRSMFQSKAQKYEAIASRDKQQGKVKQHVIDKYVRKADLARGVAARAEEEITRIQSLLEEMSA